jgi:pyruvate dehydrogenase E2 component (dihydrolipoamide acetyltransferase)
MTTEFHLPALGDDIESGDILSILVSEGDTVEAEQGVLEIETDKATVEVPSPTSGRIAKIHVGEGDTVPVGGLLITIEEADSAAAVSSNDKAVTAGREAPIKKAPPAPNAQPPVAPTPAVEPPTATNPPAVTAAQRDHKAATVGREEVPGDGRSTSPAGPAVRRLGRELGVDLTLVTAAAPSGRLTKDDVLAYVRRTTEGAAQQATPAADGVSQDNWGAIRTEPLSKIRQTIAKKMTESYSTIPQLTNFDDADITELEHIRQASKADYARQGIKLTNLTFILKAIAASLKVHPVINASLDSESQQIIYKQYINIGIAVDTDRGLVVPVMRDVDQMSVQEVAAALSGLAENTRQGDFAVDDLRGSTFTISNLGAVGGSYSTPIINPPNVAILLPGRARKMPMVVEDRIEPRLVLPLSLTYDHRVVDGAAAARFLNEIKGYLQAPSRLLIAP